MTDISREAVAAMIDTLRAGVIAEASAGPGPEMYYVTDADEAMFDAAAMLRAQADEIDRLKQVKEKWHDADRKSSARIEVLERALRELLEASEMSERDLELCEYETIMEDAQARTRELLP